MTNNERRNNEFTKEWKLSSHLCRHLNVQKKNKGEYNDRKENESEQQRTYRHQYQDKTRQDRRVQKIKIL